MRQQPEADADQRPIGAAVSGRLREAARNCERHHAEQQQRRDQPTGGDGDAGGKPRAGLADRLAGAAGGFGAFLGEQQAPHLDEDTGEQGEEAGADRAHRLEGRRVHRGVGLGEVGEPVDQVGQADRDRGHCEREDREARRPGDEEPLPALGAPSEEQRRQPAEGAEREHTEGHPPEPGGDVSRAARAAALPHQVRHERHVEGSGEDQGEADQRQRDEEEVDQQPEHDPDAEVELVRAARRQVGAVVAQVLLLRRPLGEGLKPSQHLRARVPRTFSGDRRDRRRDVGAARDRSQVGGAPQLLALAEHLQDAEREGGRADAAARAADAQLAVFGLLDRAQVGRDGLRPLAVEAPPPPAARRCLGGLVPSPRRRPTAQAVVQRERSRRALLSAEPGCHPALKLLDSIESVQAKSACFRSGGDRLRAGSRSRRPPRGAGPAGRRAVQPARRDHATDPPVPTLVGAEQEEAVGPTGPSRQCAGGAAPGAVHVDRAPGPERAAPLVDVAHLVAVDRVQRPVRNHLHQPPDHRRVSFPQGLRRRSRSAGAGACAGGAAERQRHRHENPHCRLPPHASTVGPRAPPA